MVSAAHVRPAGRPRAKRWFVLAGILLAVLILWWRAGDVRDVFGRQYEYEEDLTVDLNGTGTLTVNASLAALSALRGLDVDPLGQSVDRDRIRALYESTCDPRQVRAAALAVVAAGSSSRSTSSSTTCGN